MQLVASGIQPKKTPEARKKPRTEDRGLRASEGKFKGGVLYVKPASQKPKEDDFRGGRISDRLFNEGGTKCSGKPRKKGKEKKGKGKKGKKRRR